MRIGIICEGHSDRAVISNIILGASNLESNDIKSILPVYKLDETDLAALHDRRFSNWTHVKRECEEKELISAFLSIEGQDFVVIHIDTAECELYNVNRPARDGDYCVKLHKLVVNEIQKWLGGEYWENIICAVAIEETEAWLLSLYTSISDTSSSLKPKEKFRYEMKRKDKKSNTNEENYYELSKPFRKEKSVKIEKMIVSNCSLAAFYKEIKNKLPQKEI